MARIRSIKPEFFTSETVSQLPLRTRLTWIGLWTECDNYGRVRDNVKLIKAAVWPLDDVSPKDIDADLNTLADCGLIVRYTVAGRGYIQVTNWKEHQYKSCTGPAKYPGPDESDGRLEKSGRNLEKSGPDPKLSSPNQGSGVKGQDGKGQGSEDSDESSGPRKRGSRLPDDWKPTTADVEWQRSKGISDLLARREFEKFGNYWRAKSGKDAAKLDWSLTWHTWLMTAQERAPKPSKPERPAGWEFGMG